MLIAIISKVELWMALVALNLTIVGLSSLAEKRSVIGIEYGRYLLDRYKIYGFIRLFHMLVFVAVVDAISIVSIWISFIPMVSAIVFALLSISTCIVIFFLFAYVLRVHDGVKMQIYKSEILGLYNNNGKPCNFYGDVLVGMRNGDRTSKKLSSNVLRFFDQYNEDTIRAFNELFGPDSVVYDRHALLNGEAHDYSVYENEKHTGVKHISWEFFQMFRYSEIQERWILEILRLFNGSYANKFPRLRLYNVVRVLGQINRVGFSEGLYKYKFLDYLFPYIKDSLKIDEEKYPEKRIDLEEYLFEQLAIFMANAMQNHPTTTYEESVGKVLNGLLSPEFYSGTLSHSERLLFLSKAKATKYNILLAKTEKEIHSISIIFDFGNVLVDWNPDYLYQSLPDYNEHAYRAFKEHVINSEWISEVDASEKMDDLIDAKIREFPKFENMIRLFHSNWQSMIKCEVNGMYKLLLDLQQAGYHLYGLSNWCKEEFTPARKKYKILQLIDDYMISGGLCKTDGTKCLPKPYPEIYKLFLDHFGLKANQCFFIDDNQVNVDAAINIGMKAVRFKDANQIRRCLL